MLEQDGRLSHVRFMLVDQARDAENVQLVSILSGNFVNFKLEAIFRAYFLKGSLCIASIAICFNVRL